MTPEQLLQQAGEVVSSVASEIVTELALRVARCIDARRQAYLADPSLSTSQALTNTHFWANLLETHRGGPISVEQQKLFSEAAAALEANLVVVPGVGPSGACALIVVQIPGWADS